MGNPQYFSKFTGLLFAKGMENARPRRSSPFRLESLEARVLLSGDLGGAMSVADILNSSTFGQQTVAQNTQPVQVQAISYSIPSPTPALSPATSQSTGNVFYVSPGGSDSNAGSASSPWHSIHAAAQRLQAGDTAILMDGVYEEGSIRFGTSGTADNRITLKAQNKWGAILSSTSSTDPAISVNASYITIEDLRISVSPNNVAGGLSSMNGAIRAWESTAPTTGNPSTGYVGFTARGVLVDASGQRSVGIKTNQDFSLIENCEIHSSLEAFNNTDTVFRNNTIYGGDAWGDSIYGKGGVRNFQVYNNIVHMQAPGGRGLFLGGNSGTQWVYDPSTGYEAYNSIAHDNTIINETGNANAMTLGQVGTMNSTLQNNVMINGGQLFQTTGGPYLGSPAPMPVNATLSNNTFA